MSSSGLVLPSGRSVREAQVTGISWAAPLLTRSKVPEPFCRSPLHTTSARRSAVAIHASLHLFSRILREITRCFDALISVAASLSRCGGHGVRAGALYVFRSWRSWPRTEMGLAYGFPNSRHVRG